MVIGEGALLAALTRARDHTMQDIVATIQAEQDEAIRAPLPGLHDDHRRPGDWEDCGGAASCCVPALLQPSPLRVRRCPGSRTEPGLS